MSTVGPIASAVPPASISDRPPPPATITPTSQPNFGTSPPSTTFVPPQASGSSPPRALISAPPLAIPPESKQSPHPPDEAPPPRKLASSPPPQPSKVIPPAPSSSPPSPTTPSDPPLSSTPPPSSPTTPPPSPPTAVPPSVPLPAPEPPTNSPPPQPSVPPPTSSPPPLPSLNPPANSLPPKPGPHGSPPPPRKSPPITSPPPPPHKPPAESPPLNSPPASPEHITPSKSPPSPISAPPPSLPSPSPTNSSKNSSSPLPIPLAPPPHSDIPPPYSKYSPNTRVKANSTENNGTNAAVAAGVGVSLGIIALSLIILMVWCVIKRKKETSLAGRYVMPSPYGSSPRTDSTLKINSSAPLIQSGSESVFDSRRDLEGLAHSRLLFSYDELAEATDRFSPNNLLGEGGFGYVYKGKLPLPDGRMIAVKQLKIGSGQGEREFQAEVEIISRIHHRHLVSLVGYCVADSRRLLVYEYVPNNTLYFHLHGEGRPPMDWATRVKVAAGAARGLAYLHEDCHPRVIHRDIKSSNILLNENFDARVSDFGLAKLALDANTHVTTRVMGTFGYMAPEYASSGKLTEKSDVYSFGVVLLELITGRKPVDSSQPLGDESLVEWARPLLSHAIETAEFGPLADPRLENNYIDAEMFIMIEAAAACVRHSATKRPRMGQVVRAFDSILPSDIANGIQMGQSMVYNSAEQSAEIRLFRKMAFGSQNYSTDYFSGDNSQVHGENILLVQIESTHSDRPYEHTNVAEPDSRCDSQITRHDSHRGE